MKLKKNSNKPEETKKKAFVTNVFNEIAPKYDFVNHLLSFGIDYWWRKKLINIMSKGKPHSILDIATGTGILAIKSAKKTTAQISAYDISKQMLIKAEKNIKRKKLEKRIALKEKDCENLEKENAFDAIIMGFGIRNFNDPKQSLNSILTALKENGNTYILEFSKPSSKIFRKIYFAYLSVFLPIIGGLFTGNMRAYRYFQKSIKNFYSGKDFLKLMTEIGYKEVRQYKMTAGIASIYIGKK
jgi:demethylmenaquinone methyltransferase/2-methoxy-6-polyprenyl-1,4-benzoquinol methylase